MQMNRRTFLKSGALASGALLLPGCANFGSNDPIRNMCNQPFAKRDKVKIGIIGVGARGIGAVIRLAKIADAQIEVLCDLDPKRTAFGQSFLEKDGRKKALELHSDPEAWKKMLQMDLDLIYIVTPWELHTPMAVAAMEHGKHAAVEVPAATTMEECWQLVETSERTGRHCVMLENCCYDFFELLTLSLVRQGQFGELTHAEGAYIHSMPGLANPQMGWRGKHNYEANGNLYPTHGLGPIAQCLNINRGNQFTDLVSMSSQNAAARAWMKRKEKEIKEPFNYRGDMNTSLIQCASGATVMVQHDVSSPRPYSRIHLLQGSEGFARKWPGPSRIALQRVANGHRWLNAEEMKTLENEFGHPLSRVMAETAKTVGGHGGMDFIMDYRLIYCLKNGLAPDMDCYDAAAWSAVTPLSQQSLKKGNDNVTFPDFTRGNWQVNKPLGLVTVDPARLPVINVKKADKKQQLNVH